MSPYLLKVRLGDDVQTVGYESRGRMVTEACRYAEEGYFVSYLED